MEAGLRARGGDAPPGGDGDQITVGNNESANGYLQYPGMEEIEAEAN